MITALLSLDVTVVVLTPIVYSVAIRRRIDALPFLFACTFVANTASLVLPISNLTNLLVYHQLDDPVRRFRGDDVAAESGGGVVNLLLFSLIFRRQIPRRFSVEAHEDLPELGWWFWVAGLVLALTLSRAALVRHFGYPASARGAGRCVVLLAIGYAGNRSSIKRELREVSWPVLVFVMGMLVPIRGFE